MSGTGTGLDAQLGVGLQSAYGTYQAPDRFYEFDSAALSPDVKKLRSRGRGGGQYQRASRVRTSIGGGSGTLTLDAVTKGIGRLLYLAFGQVATTQIDTTAEYRHRFTPDAVGLRGIAGTVQGGWPMADTGTVQPISCIGGKITETKFSCAMDDLLKITTTWDFQKLVTTEPLEPDSYPQGAVPFTFLDGELTIDGSSAATVKSVDATMTRPLKIDRRSFGGNKREPLQNGELAVTGEFGSEFESVDAYDAWVTGEQLADLVLTFLGPTIPTTTNPYKLVMTVPLLEYDGSAPTVDSDDVLEQTLPFKALWNETTPLWTVDFHTDDVTP
jgi:hypothetical protein